MPGFPTNRRDPTNRGKARRYTERRRAPCIVPLQDQDESERRLASEGQPYKSGLRGDGEDAEGAAGAVDDFEGGGDDHGAGGGQLIEIAKAGEAKLSAAVHDVVVRERRVKLGGLAGVGSYRFDSDAQDVEP